MQSAILVILFLVLTAASYFAYPMFGIKVSKSEVAPLLDDPDPKVVTNVNKPEPEPEEIDPPVTDKPDKPEEPEKPDMPVAIVPPKEPMTPTTPTTPDPSNPTTAENPVTPTPPKTYPDGFVPPEFPPIEKFVGDWKAIPSSVFPKDIILKVSVVCKSDFGGSTLKPGSAAVALSEENGILTVAPSETVPVTGTVAMEDTNLKEVLTQIYDNWKDRQIATARAAFLYRQNASARSALAGQFTAAQKTDVAGNRPVQNEDNTVPICVDSINAGKVQDIRLRSITSWSPLQFEEIDGTKYWTVIVDYKSKTLFGEIPTQAQALIRNNEVVKWIYTGSGEVVP